MSGNTDNIQKCFGSPQEDKRCLCCEYLESCRYSSRNPVGTAHRGDTVSLEEFGGTLAIDVPIKGEDRRSVAMKDVLDVVMFLMRIDDYTLEILDSVLSHESDTVVGIAKAMGLTRQAIHRKIDWICRKYPVFIDIFRTHLRRGKRIKQSRDERLALIEAGLHPEKHDSGILLKNRKLRKK